MSELPMYPARQPHAQEELIMVGIRLDGSHDGPQFYTVVAVGGDNERPITADGRLLFFINPQMAAQALALDPSMARTGEPPKEIETFCDVAEALHLINAAHEDPDGVVLDCLLIFDDLVRATRLHMPDRYQGLLTELTARLTERDSLRKIFSSHELREHVEDALLWCVGAIAVKSRMITE